MFDLGFTELLLIMVVALLVVGPERLPGVARKVGRWFGQARAYITSVRSDIERELKTDELRQMLTRQEEEIRKLKDMVHDTAADVEQEIAAGTDYLVKAVDDADEPARSAEAEQTPAQIGTEPEPEPELNTDMPDTPEKTPTDTTAPDSDERKA
jgi:sec-independent protein translocase protein TatB